MYLLPYCTVLLPMVQIVLAHLDRQEKPECRLYDFPIRRSDSSPSVVFTTVNESSYHSVIIVTGRMIQIIEL